MNCYNRTICSYPFCSGLVWSHIRQYSEVPPGGAQGIVGHARDWIQVAHVQGKCTTCTNSVLTFWFCSCPLALIPPTDPSLPLTLKFLLSLAPLRRICYHWIFDLSFKQNLQKTSALIICSLISSSKTSLLGQGNYSRSSVTFICLAKPNCHF